MAELARRFRVATYMLIRMPQYEGVLGILEAWRGELAVREHKYGVNPRLLGRDLPYSAEPVTDLCWRLEWFLPLLERGSVMRQRARTTRGPARQRRE